MKTIRDFARTLARECDVETLKVLGDAIHNHLGGHVSDEHHLIAARINEAVAIAERLKAEADADSIFSDDGEGTRPAFDNGPFAPGTK